MAKKTTDHKTDHNKGKPAAIKSPEKATPAKQPKLLKNKKKTKEPLNREERKKAAWLRKSQRKAAQQAVTEVGTKASAGLTYAQLEASGLIAKPSKPKTSLLDPSFDSIFDPILDQALRQMVTEQAQQFESADELAPTATSDPESEIIEGSLGVIGLRNVLETEARQLLERTRAIFNTYCGPSILTALLAVEDAFEKEPEDSLLRLQLAEVILADDPTVGIEDFLEGIWSQVLELQIVASSLDPESELEKSADLNLIDKEVTANRLKKAAADEAVRLDLAWRLAGLTLGIGKSVEIDETFAELIAESKKAAEAQRRKRADFRRTLLQKLRGWKEREGRRFSKSPNEPSDEEFLSFLAIKRGNAYVEQFLLTRDATAQANQLWTELKARFVANTNDPENAVMRNATAMRGVLDALAQIKALHRQLEELDKVSERGGVEGASWINELHPLSKRNSRGPRGMRHWLQQVRVASKAAAASA